MSMLGYDPKRYHDGRRSRPRAWDSTSALTMSSPHEPDLDQPRRRRLIYNGRLHRHISSEEAADIVRDLGKTLAGPDITLYNGVSYRHIMVWHGGPADTVLTPPHDISDKPVTEYLPQGPGLSGCAI